MSWISTKERMPNDGETVVVYSYYYSERAQREQRTVITGFKIPANLATGESGWYVHGGFGATSDLNAVTHWQPLPEPPEVEK